MQSEDKTEGPVLDRWLAAGIAVGPDEDVEENGLDIFNLSAGVMTAQSRTANRIDGLLAHLLESPAGSRYMGNIDRNLDYLFTHLQLDMIERVAKDVSARESATKARYKFLRHD